MAVALDWGLIVPVIKRADELSIAGLARAANDLADRARTKQLKPDDVAGGTFTITNPGVFGGLLARNYQSTTGRNSWRRRHRETRKSSYNDEGTIISLYVTWRILR